MRNAVRFKQNDVGRQKGELARVKVIQGPDFGAVYVILGSKATVGRGDENDIVITDLKASRQHAQILAVAGGWTIKDGGSANGILFNGTAVREAKIKLGDTFTIGETTLEFTTSDVGTQMLVAPPKSIDQVLAEQKRSAELQGKANASGYNLFGGQIGGTQTTAIGGQSKNRIPLILGVGVVVYFLLSGDTKQSPSLPKSKTDSQVRDLASYLPQPEVNKTAESIFKDGFREFTDGNYSRARTQFETVLQISPGHTLATIYLENCTIAVNNAVKVHLENGKKSYLAGKLRDARGHYERVQRLLFRDQSNPDFIEAKEQFDKVSKEISGVPAK